MQDIIILLFKGESSNELGFYITLLNISFVMKKYTGR